MVIKEFDFIKTVYNIDENIVIALISSFKFLIFACQYYFQQNTQTNLKGLQCFNICKFEL